MSKIVIGTWGLSGDYGVVQPKIVQEILEFCYSSGIKEYDTAPNYGNGFAEFFLGFIFKNKDVLVNTKIGNLPFFGKCFEINELKESFRQSLLRLRRENINILFLHNPRGIDNYEAILAWMNDLKQEGKIKYSGICLARGWDYSSEIDIKNFDVIQDDANLIDRTFETKDFKPNLFYARSPLASGILSGSLSSCSAFEKDDHRSEWLKGARLKEVLTQIEKLNIKEDLATAARNFILNHPKVDKAIFGIKNLQHAKELLQSVNKNSARI
jgi:aryl-alcohol dehydrogenase-like predicted oxidoreductase